LAEQNKNNGGAEGENDMEPIDINSNELVLEPMDYPDTVEAVFKYGSEGRFASWAPLAKYVYKIYKFEIIIPFDHAYSRNKSSTYI